MGMPLPTGTLYQIQHKYWPDEEDYSQFSDAQRMERQDDAYRGKFKKPLRKTDASEPDHNVIDNRCEPIVSTGVDFLYGAELEFEVSHAEDDTPDEEAEAYLDAVWDANVKMPLLAEYEINSAVFGHGFLKLIPDDPDTAPYPSLAVLDPRRVSVMTYPADVRKVMRYAFTFPDVDSETGATIERRQLTERDAQGRGWTIRDQVRRSGMGMSPIAAAFSAPGTRAQMDADAGWEDEGETPWPYPWSPIHDVKNMPEPNSFWGKSDLRLDLIHLNDVLNFNLSNINRIIYYHAHPVDVFFGIHPHELVREPGASPCFPNINARVEHIEMSGAGLVSAQQFVEDIRESMDELSHVPSVAVGRLKNLPGVPSGVALKVANRPLMAQTMQKRALRGAMLTRLSQHILELKRAEWATRKITLHWPEMMPSDDYNEAQTAQIWQGIGVSADTLLQRGGFDPDVEREKKAEDAPPPVPIQIVAGATVPGAVPGAQDGSQIAA